MEHATPEMIDAAEANIREDHRSGKISKEQFQKEMLIVARARQEAAAPSPQTNTAASKNVVSQADFAVNEERNSGENQWPTSALKPSSSKTLNSEGDALAQDLSNISSYALEQGILRSGATSGQVTEDVSQVVDIAGHPPLTSTVSVSSNAHPTNGLKSSETTQDDHSHPASLKIDRDRLREKIVSSQDEPDVFVAPAPQTNTDAALEALEIRYREGFVDGEQRATETIASALDQLIDRINRRDQAPGKTSADDINRCPICAEPFKPDDICATDIELLTVHAECLDGCEIVDLETGEPTDKPLATYRYSEVMEPAPPQTNSQTDDLSPEDTAIATCEACGKHIQEGDPYLWGPETDLCGECAPIYQALIDEPEGFVNAEGEPLTVEQCRTWFDEHIAAGGKATDSMATIDRTIAAPPENHVPCPCTTFEQDEDCPVGYPSLLCTACDGKGIAPIDKVAALAAEMMKVAAQVGEPDDPFAAWETIDLVESQRDRLRNALEPFAEAAQRFDQLPVSASLPQQCWFTPESLREARAALATTEGQPDA